MKFKDTHINKEMRYSIGVEKDTGGFYLSIPVSNRFVDYEEFYEISKQAHDSYPSNLEELNKFVENCKAHLNDNLLIIKPGRDRGV